jgi:putative chitinase
MISRDQLAKFSSKALPYYKELCDAFTEFSINTPARQAAFLAQVAHESSELTRWEENLNYSADGLVATWPSRFTKELAAKYARKPTAIANLTYGNRMGNGSESSGDGWKYRGRGPIQITGKDNYKAAGAAIGVDLVANPDRAAQRDCGLRIAGWFWKSRGLNELADAGSFDRITKLINGGTHGSASRISYWNKAKQILAVP